MSTLTYFQHEFKFFFIFVTQAENLEMLLQEIVDNGPQVIFVDKADFKVSRH